MSIIGHEPRLVVAQCDFVLLSIVDEYVAEDMHWPFTMKLHNTMMFKLGLATGLNLQVVLT